jgi:chemotaxis family two-component system sensor kinase Cph1
VQGRAIEWRVDDLPTVHADPSLLRVALAHLLSNAVKFTRGRADARIEILPVVGDGEAGLAVRDNGVGFDPAQSGRLFGLFQRLNRPDEFEGSGLGLALVRRVVEKHGGRVWAEGEPGAGATFYLTLGAPASR